MPSSRKAAAQENKVQVTLSKFFSSAGPKKTKSGPVISTDQNDDFQVIDAKATKRKSPNDADDLIKTSSKKPRPQKSSTSSSGGQSSKKSSEELIEQSISPGSSQDANGLTESKKSSDTSSSKTISASEKLQKFNLEENEEKVCVSDKVVTSKNCPVIDFTPCGDVVPPEVILNSDSEEEDKSSSSSSKRTASSKKKSSASFLSQFAPNKNKKTGSVAVKYTPLEQQFVDIKAQYPDALLLVECGYKYRFFGEDAETAAKVLKIFCHLDHNFMTASIPVHRLFVHVRRLVSAGHKVGVVKQTETAHLKAAGDNKSGPFSRKLSALYTKSTLIGEDVDSASGESDLSSTLPESHYLMCIYEQPQETAIKTVHVGLMCVDPATGDMVFDCFQDSTTYTELETRISHLKPVEILLSTKVSDRMNQILTDISTFSATKDDRIRIEKLDNDEFLHSQAVAAVSTFYSNDHTGLQKALKLEKPVISCLSALISYLRDFKLDKILSETSNFRPFSVRSSYMHLSGQCLRNLEVFANSCDGSERGSLFWMLNHTRTKFGSRLLRRWIAQPLLDKDDIEARLDAVEEIRRGDIDGLKKLKDMMIKMPDVERGLCSIYHKKSSAVEFFSVAKALEKIWKELLEIHRSAASILQSSLLKSLLSEIPELLSDIGTYSSAISEKAARENDKKNLFVDDNQFPNVCSRKKDIQEVMKCLNDHRKEVRLALKQPGLNFVTVNQIEFLVEVKNTQMKEVPSNWTQISSTKVVSRFHTPFIVKQYRRLNELKEQLVVDVTEAWQEFLEQFSLNFTKYKRAVNKLATLDCLMSLAKTASQDSFCKPVIDADNVHIDVTQGRHPIIDALKGEQEQFVPNDTELKASDTRVMVISGPNMGGKSSYIRQVALITILAQVGSYVPAESAHIGIVDAIYTRMGAADEIFKGQSTFMLELQEASDIMTQVTDRSLVILDELGRGTSTHDGVAIAHATLHHFVTQCKCLLLFVTHFPMLSEFHDMFPGIVKNFHMAFLLNDEENEGQSSAVEAITFLYQLTEGAAKKSYGLNVARLAEVDSDIIQVAALKSKELEAAVNLKMNSRDSFMALWNVNVSGIKEVVEHCTESTV
ncbi:DNA mismatch repair protein Msh3 [Aplysia californica]|uniref:DNA mismatch repair protein n=1 Tax=Aplysia californica TaxID=6500 RepID=A0ABM0JC91_APLCA|nr:DNA mismatch repair protein Msh3 [Aplysia californica]